VWRKAGKEELEEFTGEQVQEGGIEEQGVGFEFCLYERV
jgi:dihydrofolate reductase